MAKVSESLEKSGNKGDAEDEETYEGGTVMAPWSEKDHQSQRCWSYGQKFMTGTNLFCMTRAKAPSIEFLWTEIAARGLL